MNKQSAYLEWDQWWCGLWLGERFEEFLVGFLVFEAGSLAGLQSLLLTFREDKLGCVAWPGAGTAVADPHHDGELRTTDLTPHSNQPQPSPSHWPSGCRRKAGR